MSASSAENEITNLVKKEEDAFMSIYKEYSDSQSKYLVPINTNSYSQQIVFDTRELMKTWWCPANSYLALPVKITSSGSAYADASPQICFKESVLNLISGVLVNLSGNQIVNSTNQMFYNNLRLKLEHDLSWRQLNDYEWVTGYDDAKVDLATVGRTLPTNVSADNAGLAQRIRFFKSRLTFSGGEFQGVFHIPLCYIHTVFQQMEFPVINSQFQLTFLLNTSTSTSGSQYPPLLVPTGTAYPKIVVAGNDQLSEPRLYYNDLSFKSELGKTLSSMLESGITRKLYFYETELIKVDSNKTTERQSRVITPSVIAPHRLFICSPATTAWEKPDSNVLPGSIARVGSFQVSINNTPIYSRPLESDYELYSQIKDEFANVGSDIAEAGFSFERWRNGNSVLVCSFSKRSKDKLVNGNASASISIDLIPATGSPAVDYYAIVERKKSMLLEMSTAGTRGLVGDGW